MEPNEMMVNEEVVETATEATEEIVKKSSGKGFKIVAGVGLAIVVGGLAVKYVIILGRVVRILYIPGLFRHRSPESHRPASRPSPKALILYPAGLPPYKIGRAHV